MFLLLTALSTILCFLRREGIFFFSENIFPPSWQFNMAGHVPVPPTFLPCPREPSIPFDMWMQMFRNYMLINATGAAWSEAHRRATLLHCLGAEGQRNFYSLLDTGDSFDSAVAALEKHYTPKVNVAVERHAFRQQRQAPHETIAQYVTMILLLNGDSRTERMKWSVTGGWTCR